MASEPTAAQPSGLVDLRLAAQAHFERLWRRVWVALDEAEGLAAALAQIRIYSESARNALARRDQWIGYAVKCGATEAQIEEAKVTK